MAFHNRDYILRVIEQIGQMLARLAGTLRNGSDEELTAADSDLNAAAFQAGLNLDLARRLSMESLSILIAPTGEVEPGRCWLLAELLYLRGLQADGQGNDADAREYHSRALYLYRMVRSEWAVEIALPAAGERIAILETRLSRD